MNNHSAPSTNTPTSNTLKSDKQLPGYLLERHQKNTIFQWWYHFTCPPEPEILASFEEKEIFRRGRTISNIILILLVVNVVSIPAAINGSSPSLTYILLVTTFSHIVTAALNRSKHVNSAGLLLVFGAEIAPIVNIMTAPGGLSLIVLPNFVVLMMPLVISASVLPTWWVFVVAAINCLYTVLSMTVLPQTPEFTATLHTSSAIIIVPLLLSQIIVSAVAFIWVRDATKALARADRAEEILKLEHDLAIQTRAAAQQKQQLEASIQKVLETHIRVANGDYHARVPLTQDNILWQVSGSLNNLLARFQRSHQASEELQRLQYELQRTHEENTRLVRTLTAISKGS